MKRHILPILFVVAMLVTACGPGVMPEIAEAPAQKNAGMPLEGETYGEEAMVTGGVADAAAPEQMRFASEYSILPDVPIASPRLIIKNADLKLLVADTDVAIDRITQVVGDYGGYVVSSRVWYQVYDTVNYKYATITIGMPVDEFERAMRRLRDLAVQVQDETASGQDVTDQFVDLQSRVENFEATRARIQSFLNDAKNVDEALRINQQLAEIEAQIEEIKGRMNYLEDRSAFSTITLTLSPELHPIEPQPIPDPELWSLDESIQNAMKTVTGIYRSLMEIGIWILIVILPVFGPPVLIVWGIYRFVTRKKPLPVSGREE